MDTRVLSETKLATKAQHRRRTSTVKLNSFRQAGFSEQIPYSTEQRFSSRTDNLICGTGKVQGDSGKLRERVHHTIPERTLLGAPVEGWGNALGQLFGGELSDPS
jgi:hypothetical protein